MSRWFLLTLAACAPDIAGLPEGEAPPPYTFNLSAGNVVAGGNLTLSFTGAPANANVRFAYSTAGLGAGACPPQLNGRCLDIRNPSQVFPLQAVANNAGSGSLTLAVPSNLGGRSVAFQAVITGATTHLSNPIGRAIANPGTTVSPAVDGDGDGFTPDQRDCADFDTNIRPNATDRVGDGRDLNCDNHDGTDADRDGSASVGSGGDDCDDAVASINPTALDRCNSVDDDCDGQVDQGPWGDSCQRTETYTLGGGPVDLLFMVDNSGSMSEEQGRLQAAVGALLNPLVQANMDLHVGVVTSDADDPSQSGRLVTASGTRWHAPTANSGYVAWTQAAVNVGVNGSADEKGLLTTGAALTPPLSTGYNNGFLRPNSNIHVVFLTDEHDYSAPLRPLDWIANFDALRPPTEITMAHGIIGPVGGCATAEDGSEYRAVMGATGGLEASVCDTDYRPFMGDLATELLSLHGGNQGQAIVLGAPADPSTLVVTANVPGLGQVIVTPQQWVWDASTRTLTIQGLVLPQGTTITVEYDV